MRRRVRVLILTFIESLATILLERGLYFFTEDRLEFSSSANLWLALVFGVLYVIGALVSHPIAHRLGERRVLYGSLILALVCHVSLAVCPLSLMGPALWVLFPLIALSTGLKWPVIESYMGAGHDVKRTLKMVGRFNITWSSAVPVALVISGPMIAIHPATMFVAAAVLNVVALVMTASLPKVPPYLADDHPDRISPELIARYKPMLTSSRWSMLPAYALLFLLAPLLPIVFNRFALPVEQATAAAALVDVGRVATFVLLGFWTAWHGRWWPMGVAMVTLPIGFAAAMFGPSLPIVLGGELLFGFAAGMTYYAALYYAMVVRAGSVDAGGVHEGLIGGGFAIGPMIGLIGMGIAGASEPTVSSVAVTVLPFVVLCTVLAAWPMFRSLMSGRAGSPSADH